jgi:ribosomal protein L10
MRIAVTWEMCGFVDVDAHSLEKAMNKFKKESDNIKLPKDGVYVDGSFRLSSNDVEEMRAMSE